MTLTHSVADLILKQLDSLTPTETRVARGILSSYPASGLRSASAIARASKTSSATVLRFIAKLGFDGLPRFHEALRDEIDHQHRSPFDSYAPSAADAADASAFVREMTQTQIDLIVETMARLSEEVLAAIRHLLLSSSALWIMGGRVSQAVALYLYENLQLLRPSVHVLGPWPAPIPDQLAQVGRGDCLIVFDFRRYDAVAAFAARYVKGKRGRVIVVTDPYLSPASHHADHTLVVTVEGRALLDSCTAAIALADLLVGDLVAHGDQTMRQRVSDMEKARSLFAETMIADY